jgi:hypothetical protein
MNPRSWLTLCDVLACGLFLATALSAHACEQSYTRSPGNHSVPRAEQAFLVGQDSAAIVFSEYDDSRDADSAITCWFCTTNLCTADYPLISGSLCERGGTQSLVKQGVRLQI